MPSPADKAEDLHSRFTPDYTPEQLENLGVYDALYRGQAPRLASLGAWKPEWISEHDPKGWAQWYKRYAAGRRIPGEDERQIQRWLNFKSRHGGPFSKKPTPRRGWALRNWGIDPSKLVPEQAQDINELLDEHQRKAMQKFVQEKVAEEKQAISAKVVQRAMTRGMNSVAAGTVTPGRMQRFIGTTSKWLPKAQARNISDVVNWYATGGSGKLPNSNKLVPALFPKALPQNIQSAYLAHPIAQAAQLRARDVPKVTSPLWNVTRELIRHENGAHIPLAAQHIVNSFVPHTAHYYATRVGKPTLGGVNATLRDPATLFHELGHSLDDAAGRMAGRSEMGQEIVAWRRGSQMYRTYLANNFPSAINHGAIITQGPNRTYLPSYRQFLQARHVPLESHRLGVLKNRVQTAPTELSAIAKTKTAAAAPNQAAPTSAPAAPTAPPITVTRPGTGADAIRQWFQRAARTTATAGGLLLGGAGVVGESMPQTRPVTDHHAATYSMMGEHNLHEERNRNARLLRLFGAALKEKASALSQEKVAEEKQAISAKLVTRALGSATAKTLSGKITPARFDRFVGRAQSWLPKHHAAVFKSVSEAAPPVAAQLRRIMPLSGPPKELPQTVQTAFRSIVPAKTPAPKVQSFFGQLGNDGPRGAYWSKWAPEHVGAAISTARSLKPGTNNAAYRAIDANTPQTLLHGSPRLLREPSTFFHELGHAADDALGHLTKNVGGEELRNVMRNEVAANRRGSQLYRGWLQQLPETERAPLPTVSQWLRARRAPLEGYRSTHLQKLLAAASDVRGGNVHAANNLKDRLGAGAHGRVTTKLLDQLTELGNMKTAALSPDVQLQPHQQRVSDRLTGEDPRLLLYHGLGSGKSLSAIAAAEAAQKAHGGSYGVVVPASLRGNFQKELSKFAPKSNPEILSYSGLALGKKFKQQPDTLIMDEAQRLRNPDSASAQAARDAAAKAKRLLLLSGTPITNSPSDMASLLSMLTNRELTPRQFEDRYVGYKSKFPGIIPWLRGAQWGEVPYVKNEKELRKLLHGRVDYQPSKTPEGVDVQEEQIRVPLSKAQQKIQKAIRTKIPPGFLWKLDQEFPMSREELAKMNSFMNGLRQISLSTQSFRGDKDPLKAFDQSSKLQTALENLQKSLASDKRKKALIYSNFVESGVNPYAAALTRAGIPHGVFHGGIPTEARQKALRDYNEGKLRALLIGPAGAEGISTKGTNLIQLLDPHWNESRIQQARGRGLRFDSHAGLPEDLKNVQVQRYLSSSEEPGLLGKLLGMRRQRTGDEVLENLAQNKEQLNAAFRKILQEAGTPETAQN